MRSMQWAHGRADSERSTSIAMICRRMIIPVSPIKLSSTSLNWQTYCSPDDDYSQAGSVPRRPVAQQRWRASSIGIYFHSCSPPRRARLPRAAVTNGRQVRRAYEVESHDWRGLCFAAACGRKDFRVYSPGRRRSRNGDRSCKREGSVAAELCCALPTRAVGGPAREGAEIDAAGLSGTALHFRNIRNTLRVRFGYRKARMAEGILEGFQGHLAAVRDFDVPGGRRRHGCRIDRD